MTLTADWARANLPETGDLESLPLSALDQLLARFYDHARTREGNRFSRATLNCLRGSLSRWIGSLPGREGVNIARDPAFSNSNAVFHEVLKMAPEATPRAPSIGGGYSSVRPPLPPVSGLLGMHGLPQQLAAAQSAAAAQVASTSQGWLPADTKTGLLPQQPGGVTPAAAQQQHPPQPANQSVFPGLDPTLLSLSNVDSAAGNRPDSPLEPGELPVGGRGGGTGAIPSLDQMMTSRVDQALAPPEPDSNNIPLNGAGSSDLPDDLGQTE